jgi:hypothetical protein
MTPDELKARVQALRRHMALLEAEEELVQADFDMLESYRCAQALYLCSCMNERMSYAWCVHT